MNCKELVYLLGDYLDGTMEEQLKEELAHHLELCGPCMAFLRTYDKTRMMCRQIRPEEIPVEMRTRLKTFIMEKAREHHADIDKILARAARERREQVAGLIRAFVANRLSPTLAILFKSHRDRCEKCGMFLRGLNGGKGLPDVPAEIEEHIAEFLEALPPGEVPTLP